MLTPRIFVDAKGVVPHPGTGYRLAAGAARHVAQALRMRVGDSLALFTGGGGEYAATIVAIDGRDVSVHVDRYDPVERESPWPVTLVQAVIAADMMDFAVRKSVELGVAAIVPVLCARSQGLPAERIERRTEHWRQIVIAACEQCGRNRIPAVMPVARFSDWSDSFQAGNVTAILAANGAQSLASFATAQAPGTIVVGPEGGFTEDELERASARGATPVHIGVRVLRAETAALAALATLNALVGDAR
jgi:16S rRNA (uracil1498-N3)-methyltransferase